MGWGVCLGCFLGGGGGGGGVWVRRKCLWFTQPNVLSYPSQVYEYLVQGPCVAPGVRPDMGWSLVRCPRAVIMLRAGKVFIKRLNMPKEGLKKIFRRSGKQLLFVSLFFVFFISIFSLVATQLFTALGDHCAVNRWEGDLFSCKFSVFCQTGRRDVVVVHDLNKKRVSSVCFILFVWFCWLQLSCDILQPRVVRIYVITLFAICMQCDSHSSTLFFLFLSGEPTYTLSDLAIPDQYCDAERSPPPAAPNVSELYSRISYSISDDSECELSTESMAPQDKLHNVNGCPGDMICRDLKMHRRDRKPWNLPGSWWAYRCLMSAQELPQLSKYCLNWRC